MKRKTTVNIKDGETECNKASKTKGTKKKLKRKHATNNPTKRKETSIIIYRTEKDP